MLVIPAIDLKDGKVVRLLKGNYDEVTVYSQDPVQTAKLWQSQGAERIHIVDLDGAKAGAPKNIDTVRQIIESVDAGVQFGGGLRRREDIAAILNIGVKWTILGTRVCEDLDFAKEIVAEFGERIIVSVDVKSTKVAARGWTQTSEIKDVELIKKMQKIGVKSFIYTNILRDGTLSGCNVTEIKRVLEETGASIIYSGGISSLQDVKDLQALEKHGLAGIIIGKALYENKLDLIAVKKTLEEKI